MLRSNGDLVLLGTHFEGHVLDDVQEVIVYVRPGEGENGCNIVLRRWHEERSVKVVDRIEVAVTLQMVMSEWCPKNGKYLRKVSSERSGIRDVAILFGARNQVSLSQPLPVLSVLNLNHLKWNGSRKEEGFLPQDWSDWIWNCLNAQIVLLCRKCQQSEVSTRSRCTPTAVPLKDLKDGREATRVGQDDPGAWLNIQEGA